MAVDNIRLSAEASRHLGRKGVATLRQELHAIDCQVCGMPLGADIPGVSFTDYGGMAQALLHHLDCGKPYWRRIHGFISTPEDGRYLSYHAFVMSPSIPVFQDSPPAPILFINPGLETAFVHCRNGRWRVDTLRKYRARFGMEPSSRLNPLPKIKKSVLTSYRGGDSQQRTLNLQVGERSEGWVFTAPSSIAARIVRAAGMAVLLTATEDPMAFSRMPDITVGDVVDLLRPEVSLMGWAHYFPDRQPPRPADVLVGWDGLPT
jgi:hypothetical protein